MRAQIPLFLLSLLFFLPCSLQAARLELRQAGTDITEASVLVGRDIEIELWIDSEDRPLSGAAIFLSFDDAVFELVSQSSSAPAAGLRPFAPGSFLSDGEVFRNDLLLPDDPAAVASGTQLDYSVVRAADQGRGPVATFRLRALTPSRESLVRIDESGIRETRVFLPDGTQGAFRFITPLSVVVQGISFSVLPDRLVLPRGAVDATTFPLDELIFDPLYGPEEITWTLSSAGSLDMTRDPETNLLRIAAPADQSPWEQLVLTATNPDGQSASDTVEIFVVAPPKLPAELEPLAFAEDEPFELRLDELVDDPDTPAAQLQWTASSSPELSVTIAGSPAVARLTPRADWSGAGQVTLTVTDDFGFADTTRALVAVEPVNDPPYLQWTPNVRLTDGRQDSSIVVADLVADKENDALTLSWSETEQVIVEQRNGRLVFANRNGWTGTQRILLQVTDSNGLSISAPLNVTVVPSLPPSIIGAPQRQGIPAGDHFFLTLDELVVDPDDPDGQLSWKVSGQQQLLVQLSGSHIVRVEAPADFAGIETLTFAVTDPTGTSATFELRVFSAPLSGEPLLAALPDVRLPVDGMDASLDLDDYVFDLDHQPGDMEFFAPALEDLELHVDPLTHVLTIAPTAQARIGSLELELRVVDPDGHEAVQRLRIELIGDPQDTDFGLAPLPAVNFSSDRGYTFDLDDYVDGDVDPDQVQWTVEGQQNLSAAIDPGTHRISLSVADGWTGSEQLTLIAAYEDLPLRHQILLVTVEPAVAEQLPELAPFPQLALTAGDRDESLDLDDYIANADPAAFTWEVNGQSHVNAVVDAQTRRLLIIAEPDWSGQEVLILTGRDDAGHRLEGVLRIDIAAPLPALELQPTTEMPLFAGTTEIHLDPIQLLLTDADPATLVWEAEGNRPFVVLYDPVAEMLIVKPDSPWQSSDIVTLKARDLDGNEATGHLLAQVYPTDGSMGHDSPGFQLAVVPHPLQSEYVDLFIVGTAELPQTPLLRLQNGEWHDIPLETSLPGIWQGTHALPAGQQGQVEIIALTIDADRQVLRSRFTLELVRPTGPRAKPIVGDSDGFAENSASPILSAVEADLREASPPTSIHRTK